MAPARTSAVVDGGYAAEDEFAEAAGTDGGGDGGDADAGDRRGADAGEDDACAEGEFDLEQTLASWSCPWRWRRR